MDKAIFDKIHLLSRSWIAPNESIKSQAQVVVSRKNEVADYVSNNFSLNAIRMVITELDMYRKPITDLVAFEKALIDFYGSMCTH